MNSPVLSSPSVFAAVSKTTIAAFLGAAVLSACSASNDAAIGNDLTESEAASQAPVACTDTPPDNRSTCAQQAGWGKCGETWMQARCNASCGRCPAPAVSNLPPDSKYTCDEQAAWGKCGETWMRGFCNVTCGRSGTPSTPTPPPPSSPSACDAGLVTDRASAQAKAVMCYLKKNYGKAMISGSYDRDDADWILASTGKSPAILGLDLMDYSPSRVAYGAKSTTSEDAIDWATKEKGLVTLSWHWNAPTKLLDVKNHEWWRGFYTDASTFDVAQTMNNPGSADYAAVVRDIDAIAVQLKKLQAARVPVLFRPLHEAAGTWFWWGAKGPEACMKLYNLLFDRLVRHHGLDNLIWVWTAYMTKGDPKPWYPGNDRVDIIVSDYEELSSDFDGLRAQTGGAKMVALGETFIPPQPDQAFASGTAWSYFVNWSNSIQNNPVSDVKRVYTDSRVITKDELPSFR